MCVPTCRCLGGLGGDSPPLPLPGLPALTRRCRPPLAITVADETLLLHLPERASVDHALQLLEERLESLGSTGGPYPYPMGQIADADAELAPSVCLSLPDQVGGGGGVGCAPKAGEKVLRCCIDLGREGLGAKQVSCLLDILEPLMTGHSPPLEMWRIATYFISC